MMPSESYFTPPHFGASLHGAGTSQQGAASPGMSQLSIGVTRAAGSDVPKHRSP
jgi:hypothetical protein